MAEIIQKAYHFYRITSSTDGCAKDDYLYGFVVVGYVRKGERSEVN